MNVGLIGTGAIGLPMAEQVVSHGFHLNFYARREEVIAHLKDMGGIYQNIAELGLNCDVILLILNTYEQCLECLSEVLKTMHSGVVIVHSTISPKETEMLSGLCAASGVELVSAPVTGGVAGAKKGTLTVITAGKKQVVEELKHLLSAFSTNIVYTGENIGAAAAMKLLVQLLVGIHTTAMSEALTLGVKYGLPLELIYSTICESAGVSRIFQSRAKTIMERNFEKRGTIDILAKDLKYCVELANEIACPLLMAQTCFNIFQTGRNTLKDTTEDFSAIFKLYEYWSGISADDR